jgi:hypothetical protein
VSLHVRADAAVVLRVCAETFDALGARGIVVESDRVTGHTGPSWRSWGEDLSARVAPDPAGGGVRVMVESMSRLRIVQMDWGKNSRNERRLYQLIYGRLEVLVPGAAEWPPAPVPSSDQPRR